MLKFWQRYILRAALFGSLLASTWTPPASAQYIGTVSLQTTNQTLASTVTCTGSAQTFPIANLGQPIHLASATSPAPSFIMEIDGVDSQANSFKISNPQITVGTNTFVVQGNGYLPIIRVVVTCTSGSTFSLNYSGSFAANPIANVGSANSLSQLLTTGNVQGVIPTGTNGQPVLPVIVGSVEPAINANTVQFGLDTFASATAQITGSVGTPGSPFSINPPTPSTAGEWGLAVFGPYTGTVNVFNGPWSCIPANCLGNDFSSAPNVAQLNLTAFNTLSGSVTNAPGNVTFTAAFLELNKPPTVRQHTGTTGNGTQAFTSNTLAGSLLLTEIGCVTFPCTVTNVTDTQGLTWRQVVAVSTPNGATPGGHSIWAAFPSIAAADTLTYTQGAGTVISTRAVTELTGTTPGVLNTPAEPLLSDSSGRLVAGGDIPGVTDPCNSATLKQSAPINITTAATTVLVPLVTGQAVYACGFSVTIAPSGTTADTALLEFGTGASCGTGTTALTGNLGAGDLTTATGLLYVTFADPATTITAPAGNALCLVSAGTTVNIQGVLTFVQ